MKCHGSQLAHNRKPVLIIVICAVIGVGLRAHFSQIKAQGARPTNSIELWKKEGMSKDGSTESREEENELSVSCSINCRVLWEVYKRAISEMCERIVNTLSLHPMWEHNL